MTAGLQIWDASGNLRLDATTRAGRIINIQAVSGNGSFSDSRIGAGSGFGVFIPLTTPVTYAGVNGYPPVVSVSGSTVTWTYTQSPALSGYIVSGVF